MAGRNIRELLKHSLTMAVRCKQNTFLAQQQCPNPLSRLTRFKKNVPTAFRLRFHIYVGGVLAELSYLLGGQFTIKLLLCQ